MEHEFNEDKTQVAIDLPTPLVIGTAALDVLINALAKLRSHMEPEVPHKPPTGVRVTAFTNAPNFIVPDLESGGIALLLMHPGFGWLTYRFDRETAVGLAGRINTARESKDAGRMH